jgi:hypothetical protein
VPERKPPHKKWEHWSEQLIRDAQERGELRDLPGQGKPLPDIDQPYDPLWWVKKWVEREQISVLPPSLGMRKRVEQELERIWTMRNERDVRRSVEKLNAEIGRMNATASGGPPSSIACLDVERVVERWRERRSTD